MKRVGLIAGNGRFPLVFARGAREAGVEVVAVAHQGETERELDQLVADVTWIKVGELGRMIEAFQRRGVQQAVMAGGIRKTTLFENFAPDARTMVFLGRLQHFGDDAVLRGMAGELESEGIAIVDSTVLVPSLLTQEGQLTQRAPSEQQWADIRYGVRVARAAGKWDVGQSVVVKGGVVLAVEAIEGTDAAVRRGGALGKGDIVVVKMSKPGQDLRFDVPAVGRETAGVCREAGVAVLALEAGRTLILDRDDLIAAADASGIAIVGFAAEPEEEA